MVVIALSFPPPLLSHEAPGSFWYKGFSGARVSVISTFERR